MVLISGKTEKNISSEIDIDTVNINLSMRFIVYDYLMDSNNEADHFIAILAATMGNITKSFTEEELELFELKYKKIYPGMEPKLRKLNLNELPDI